MSPAEAAVAARIMEAIDAAQRLPASGFAHFMSVSLRVSLGMIEKGAAHYEHRLAGLTDHGADTPAAFRPVKR